MILARNISTSGFTGWYANSNSAATVPFRFVFPGGGLIRIEGRNSDSDTAIPLGLVYESGVFVVPRFNQYRLSVINFNSGASLTLVERASVLLKDDYDVRYSPLIQNRSRTVPKGMRKGGFRTTHICPFDLYAGGTSIATDRAKLETGTASKDYTNCRSGEVQSGESRPYSITLNATDGVTSEFRYDYRVSAGGSGPIDISGGTNQWPFILMRVYVDPSVQGDQSGNVGSLTLGFADTPNNQGNVVIANFQQFTSSAVCGPGWNTVVVHPTTVGSVNPADVHLIRIYLTSKSGTSCAVTLDTLQFIRPTVSTKLVAFRDDDGLTECWKTALALDRYGIRGNFHVHPRMVGQTGFITKAELLAMQRSGHMIGNHGWSLYLGDDIGNYGSGPYYKQREVSAESLLRDHIRPAVWWLQDNGFEQGARIYATHQGNMLPAQADLLLETDLDVISHTSTAGENATTTNHVEYLEVQHATGYSSTPATGLLSALDAHGGLAVFYGHGNQPNQNSVMRTVIDAVYPKMKDGTYKNVTLAEMVNGVY